MNKNQALIHLKRTFGFNEFRENQWEIIEKVLGGEKILLVAKTGFGKSLCYQFPATIFDGVTLVFSPLIALMRDQVRFLNEKGIKAATINSNHSEDVEENENINRKILEDAVKGEYKVLYIAPERIENDLWKEYLPSLKISFVVVDEAHCISIWGHDFRPDYRKIKDIIRAIPKKIPVLAVTATADDYIAEDVRKQMQAYVGDEIRVVRNDLFRNNLKITVIKVNSEDEKLVFLLKYLSESNNGTGIIYAATKAYAEKYCRWLKFNGINATYYHSKVGNREEIEKEFYENKFRCIVATNALGMGLDKRDIRFIIHANVPGSLIHYYQEIGRAGRDNILSDIILLYSKEDLQVQEHFIEQSKPSKHKYEKLLSLLKKRACTQKEIIMECDIDKDEFRTIIEDLMDEEAVFKNTAGKTKYYEYNPDFRGLDYSSIENLREYKMKRLKDIIDFVDTKECRMNYICKYLGDTRHAKCGICDNDTNDVVSVVISSEYRTLLDRFYAEEFHPVLEVETSRGILKNGVAGGEYGTSRIGELIRKSKYENGGDFDEYLLEVVYDAYRKHFKDIKFDLAVFVPPTKSGDLVKNFAEKLCKKIGIPLSYNLVKVRETKEQKVFRNNYNKEENVKNAFSYRNPKEIRNKNILIIDDVFDSGKTIKEIGRVLQDNGAAMAAPITIAKTVGGNQL